MFDPYSGKFIVSSPILWVDFAISLAIVSLMVLVAISIAKRKSFTIAAAVIGGVSVLAWFFGLKFLWALSLVVMTGYVVITLLQNQSDVRDFFNFLFFKKKSVKYTQKVYDRHAICQKVALAVETLSKTKTGALITFEKNTPLTDVCKTGTILNAPVTPELLTTIFYPGTRLHDGAVVIRRDLILAASVYYTPTTKPLTGKFGSRHRAAIGISELTDSVTVVVSEETGRVSLAYHGELISVAPDSFLRTIEEYLFAEEKIKDEEK